MEWASKSQLVAQLTSENAAEDCRSNNSGILRRGIAKGDDRARKLISKIYGPSIELTIPTGTGPEAGKESKDIKKKRYNANSQALVSKSGLVLFQ